MKKELKAVLLIMWSIFVIVMSIPLVGLGCPIIIVSRFGYLSEIAVIINSVYIVTVTFINFLILKKICTNKLTKNWFIIYVSIIFVQLWCLEIWFESFINIFKTALTNRNAFIMFIVVIFSFGYTGFKVKQLFREIREEYEK